jgi:DNA-binding Xre family transcriptional regulator
MIEFQIKDLMKAKGIKSPYKQLRKAGISHSTAQGYMTGMRHSIYLEHIEIFCNLLRCTPNDLLAWTPASHAEDYPENPLQAIRKKPTINIEEKLNSMTLEEVKEKFGG